MSSRRRAGPNNGRRGAVQCCADRRWGATARPRHGPADMRYGVAARAPRAARAPKAARGGAVPASRVRLAWASTCMHGRSMWLPEAKGDDRRCSTTRGDCPAQHETRLFVVVPSNSERPWDVCLGGSIDEFHAPPPSPHTLAPSALGARWTEAAPQAPLPFCLFQKNDARRQPQSHLATSQPGGRTP
jgi:hypothetical protein